MKKSYLLGLLLLLSFILCACSSKNSDVKQTVTVTPEVTKAPSEELTVEPTEELDTVEKTVDYLSLTDSELLSLSAEEDVDFTYCVKTVNKKRGRNRISN